MYFSDYIIARQDLTTGSISFFASQKTSVPNPDPLVRGPDPDPPIIEQK
jgi:hypothetical protein